MKKYKHTLNLPKTNFPIKSKPEHELELLKRWDEEDLYNKIRSARNGNEEFILHDGPPYANGHLHYGHFLNKVLKDIVVKYNALQGKKVEFIPGWDCHGLPIEVNVDKELGPKKNDMSKVALRQKYRRYAEKFVNIQRDEFKRLGVIADWNNPYQTMDYSYEARTLRELANFVEAGLLYRDLKPVFWCPTHRTALADAEIEYKDDHESLAVYVLYPLPNKQYVMVWTTTPWTLPANFGLAAKSDGHYTQYNLNGKNVWVATDRLQDVLSDLGEEFDSNNVCDRQLGTYFCGLTYEAQFENHIGGFIRFSDHVTTDSGTGFVHIAPAHGEDDFRFGKKNNLPVVSVIDDRGKTVYPVQSMSGMSIQSANQEVADYLYDAGLLLKAYKYKHRYPYSSRSKKPVIVKTTSQWFINIDKPYNGGESLRNRALKALDEVTWLPKHGYNRIKSMLETRPDWCLSRQRTWGVPIPAFKCTSCDNYNVTADHVRSVARFFAEEGKLDEWFINNNIEGSSCSKCGSPEEIESSILDVWFDSGVSNAAVMRGKNVDLYLEGSDQHRGWFQSTLLALLGSQELIPYKAVLTHGFVVNDKGEKLSKSDGNYVDPFKFINQNGAELLRLWVASSEFKNDIKCSEEILNGVKQTSHKIRNTIRYMIGATSDFSQEDLVKQTPSYTDAYILTLWGKVYNLCLEAYDNYDFHAVVKNVENFCILDLSSFYFEVVKDVLYCGGKKQGRRIAVQNVLFTIANDMIKLMAPIMSFTMDEAWRHLTSTDDSVFTTDLSKCAVYPEHESFSLIEDMRALRRSVNAELEILRQSGEIGSSVEANVELTYPDGLKEYNHLNLAGLFGVSNVTLKYGPDNIEVKKATEPQCQRCWQHKAHILEGNELCSRCSEVILEYE